MEAQKKTILVTGCSRGGIGDALAQEFHKRGLRVFASARNFAKMQHLLEMGLELVELDVVNPESVKKAAREIGELTGGSLDILVNNAGVGYNAALTDADIEEAKDVFDVNIWGLLRVTQAVTPMLCKSKGRVVNIGSVAGKVPLPFQGVYCASKSAVGMISDNLRIELAPFGVRVINVITGGIKTGFYQHAPYRLPENSIYAPVKAEMEPVVRGDNANAYLHYPAERCAAKIADNVLGSSPTAQQWVGSEVSSVWLSTWLWHTATVSDGGPGVEVSEGKEGWIAP